MRLDRGKWQPGMYIDNTVDLHGMAVTSHAPPLAFKTREMVREADDAIYKALFTSHLENIKRSYPK